MRVAAAIAASSCRIRGKQAAAAVAGEAVSAACGAGVGGGEGGGADGTDVVWGAVDDVDDGESDDGPAPGDEGVDPSPSGGPAVPTPTVLQDGGVRGRARGGGTGSRAAAAAGGSGEFAGSAAGASSPAVAVVAVVFAASETDASGIGGGGRPAFGRPAAHCVLE